MANVYWDTEKEMPEVIKSDKSVYRIHACTKDGKKYINIREWYWKADPTRLPGKQGLCFEVTKNGDIASCLIDSIQRAIKHLDGEES